MGIDATLFINSKWSAKDISDILVHKFSLTQSPTLVFHDFAPEYITIMCNGLGSPDFPDRMIHFHGNSTKGGLRGTILSLRANSRATEILRIIGDVTGGFFEEMDCDGIIEEIQCPADGNMNFLVQHYAINGLADGRDKEAFIKALQEDKL